jgi:hypothetical protein
MQLFETKISDLSILNRVLRPDKPMFSLAAAQEILALDFDQADKDRMRQLLAKAREGMLTEAEQAESDSYERVGHLLNILQSKARRSLKDRDGNERNFKAD